MSNTQEEFLQTHAASGALSPEQAAQFLELVEGDTGSTPDTGGEPSATPAEAAKPDDVPGKTNDEPKADGGAPSAATPSEPDPAKTVILAKDGVHTIPFEKLTEAREGERAARESEQEWRNKAEAAQQELETLRAAAQLRADAGQAPTATDKNVATAAAVIDAGVDPQVFGDFSEEAIAKGIQILQQQTAAQLKASLREELRAELKDELIQQVRAELKPVHDAHQLTAAQRHHQAILDAHADAESLVESKELNDWIEAQPSFARDAYRAVLQKGTATEVIEFFDTFKKATGATQAATPPRTGDAKAAAQAVIAKAQSAVPNSISDIPGGHVGPANRAEAMDAMDGPALAAAMENMTAEQIEAYLNRHV